MKVLVTGASGFIGKRFVEMAKNKYDVVTLSLRNNDLTSLNLNGVDVIVHLAGKAHEMKKINDHLFFDINFGLTKKLAEKALTAGVPHFIYISSLKVYGDETNKILNEDSDCKPTDAYGKSKLQAEQYLLGINNDAMKIAIVRPPLVFGPEVKGNMIRLLQLSHKNIPLPFANAGNQRSMVFLDNLVELIFSIINKKASGIFLASDEKPLATDELIRLIKINMNKKPALFSLPRFFRQLLKIYKPDFYNRLFNSFVVDNTKTNQLLNFKPSYSTDFGIQKMVDWFKTHNKT